MRRIGEGVMTKIQTWASTLRSLGPLLLIELLLPGGTLLALLLYLFNRRVSKRSLKHLLAGMGATARTLFLPSRRLSPASDVYAAQISDGNERGPANDSCLSRSKRNLLKQGLSPLESRQERARLS
jgi:hypothetical protein